MITTVRYLRLPDGRVRRRTIPADAWQGHDPAQETEQQFYDRLMNKNVMGTVLGDVDETTPPPRKWREALDWTTAPEVNMTKARDIHMNRIRVERNKKLEELDVEVIEVTEGRPGRRPMPVIRDEKQALREIPQTFDLSGAANVTDLDALWPPGLPRT